MKIVPAACAIVLCAIASVHTFAAESAPQLTVKLTGADNRPFTVSGTRSQIEDYANRFIAKGDYPYAIQCYEQLIASEPRDIRPYILMGQLYESIRKYADAIRYYKKAERIVPPENPGGLAHIRRRSADAYRALAEQTNSLIYFVQAISEYEKVIDQEPENVEVLFYLGSCRLNSKDYDQAIKWFERVIQLQPQSEWAGLSKRALEMARDEANQRSSFNKRRSRNI